jgi:hypothetical protein
VDGRYLRRVNLPIALGTVRVDHLHGAIVVSLDGSAHFMRPRALVTNRTALGRTHPLPVRRVTDHYLCGMELCPYAVRLLCGHARGRQEATSLSQILYFLSFIELARSQHCLVRAQRGTFGQSTAHVGTGRLVGRSPVGPPLLYILPVHFGPPRRTFVFRLFAPHPVPTVDVARRHFVLPWHVSHLEFSDCTIVLSIGKSKLLPHRCRFVVWLKLITASVQYIAGCVVTFQHTTKLLRRVGLTRLNPSIGCRVRRQCISRRFIGELEILFFFPLEETMKLFGHWYRHRDLNGSAIGGHDQRRRRLVHLVGGSFGIVVVIIKGMVQHHLGRAQEQAVVAKPARYLRAFIVPGIANDRRIANPRHVPTQLVEATGLGLEFDQRQVSGVE